MSHSPNHLQAFKRVILIAILAVAIPMGSVLIIGGIATTAFAQAVDIPAILSADAKGPPNFVTLQYGHQFKTDVEDGGAEMSRENAFFMAGHRAELSEKTSLVTVGGYTLQAYNFRGSGSLPGREGTVRLLVTSSSIPRVAQTCCPRINRPG
jgi:hypothetical protein